MTRSMAKKVRLKKSVETLQHEEVSRKNILMAELQSIMDLIGLGKGMGEYE